MNSPVEISFLDTIQIDHNLNTPIYLQIIHEFVKAIQLGYLPEGTLLPGTRILSKQFGCNRNTIIKAFEDLQSEGWIKIVPNKGTYILSAHKQKQTIFANYSYESKSNYSYSGFNFSRSVILEQPIINKPFTLQFNEGMPDMRLAQTDMLSKIYLAKLKNKPHNVSWDKFTSIQEEYFKVQLTNYLNITRRLGVTRNQVFTTTSHQMCLYLVTQLLSEKSDKIAIARLGYHTANMIFTHVGLQTIPIELDQEGICIEHLDRVCQQYSVRFVYITSHYQYPTTVRLSAKRRIELVELAHKHKFTIIEDDFDADFNYHNQPSLPLYSLDNNNLVVYVGMFGKTLPPNFRIGYVVGPVDFIAELHKYEQIITPDNDPLKLQVLSHWIQEGEMLRNLKKIRRIYHERRDNFAQELKNQLSTHISFETPSGGLAFWVQWKEKINLSLLQKQCMNKNLLLPQNILYQDKRITAIRFGFAHLEKDEMKEALQIIANSI